jgi:hypothetical protein
MRNSPAIEMLSIKSNNLTADGEALLTSLKEELTSKGQDVIIMC